MVMVVSPKWAVVHAYGMMRTLRSLIAVAIVPLVLAGSGAPVYARTACVTPGPVAHRGGTERYVENTRDAFRQASNSGVNFWETDVRFTADDVPVIMHDDTVDRTTNGTGAVADLTYAQIAQLRTADDQPVPTLAEVMNDESVDRAYAFVEPKVMPTGAQWATFIAALTSRVGAGGPKPVIESFDPDVLDQAAVRLPGYTRALIQSAGDANPADITPHASILLKHHDSITWSRITKWTAAGLRVYAWADPAAGDDASEWARIAQYPVSGFITSSPAAYVTWRAGRVC
jgi:glycerophosphoryl diester phosphodiesterase